MGMAYFRIAPVFFSLVLGLVSGQVHAMYQKGILWQVSIETTEPSYVFGTFHSDDDAILDLPVSVRKALYQSSLLVLEMTLDPASVSHMQKAAILPEGKNLRHTINDNLIYSEAVSNMALRGSPRSLTSRMKPWAVYMSLNTPEKKSGMFQDLLLSLLAGVQNKPVTALEAAHEQVAVYDGLSLAEQVELLEALLGSYGKNDAEYEQIKDYYLQADLAGLVDAASVKNLEVNNNLKEKIQRRLVDNRNDRMVRRMKPYLEQGDAFIAVGALHLAGTNGILNQLNERGYRITRVY